MKRLNDDLHFAESHVGDAASGYNCQSRPTQRIDSLTFQCSRVGNPVTCPMSSSPAKRHSSAASSCGVFPTSDAFRTNSASISSSWRLSKDPYRLLGGVGGDCFAWYSVGLNTAGTYIGVLGCRNCLICEGS